MSYKIINVQKDAQPGLDIYTFSRDIDNFSFLVKIWDNGMFTIKSIQDKPIGYSTELKNSAMKAIETYKLKQQLSPNTLKTFEELIDEL